MWGKDDYVSRWLNAGFALLMILFLCILACVGADSDAGLGDGIDLGWRALWYAITGKDNMNHNNW